ncbi:aryl-sulfate sulfotransferase [Oecophyllibacter saccharovorans]|uniref:ribbon-helix-helix domain-containing protein n=1 Tax=Oecophyllibacter saccharovorans TaxID=2558360 RepID=UPI001143F45F|nr:ribbon-helix-helix domain-containing protein [Oecophyllibacter saccharovorans]QDH14850.1 aryl-sulfate sulfotransferase [Oecophyllibacter saccharovorans]
MNSLPTTPSGLRKRSISLSGHRTSIALEPEFWAVLEEMAQHQQQALAALVTSLDRQRLPTQPLSSLLRLAALRHLRAQQLPSEQLS